ncbi:MAG: hypothetical protein KJN61_09250 [Gammaproteobacteria bacterium]|nr:hypothetical protein [Gammaproteobacteria bacterium]
MKSPLHRRLRIPNSLAMVAALLLLITSVTGFESNREVNPSAQETVNAAKPESAGKNNVNDGVETKRRGLNLGFLLFRSG